MQYYVLTALQSVNECACQLVRHQAPLCTIAEEELVCLLCQKHRIEQMIVTALPVL